MHAIAIGEIRRKGNIGIIIEYGVGNDVVIIEYGGGNRVWCREWSHYNRIRYLIFNYLKIYLKLVEFVIIYYNM